MPLIYLFLIICLSQNAFAGEFTKDILTVKDDVLMFSLKESGEPLIYGSLITGLAFFSDEEVQKKISKNKSSTNHLISDFGNIIGNPYLDFFVPLSLYVFSEKDSILNRSSFRAAESVFFSTTVAGMLSFAVGRERPDEGNSAYKFKPFSLSNNSFPSKHMAASTALFTSYAKFYNNNYLYIFPVITAFGRVYENRHYLSDTIFGAAIGYTFADYFYKRERFKNQSFMPLIITGKNKIILGFAYYY